MGGGDLVSQLLMTQNQLKIYRVLKLMQIKSFTEFEKIMASIYYEKYGEGEEGGTAKRSGE